MDEHIGSDWVRKALDASPTLSDAWVRRRAQGSSGSRSASGRGRSTPADRLIRERDGSDPRERLTATQRRVVQRLARDEGLGEVAVRAGVHPDRIRRWLTVPRVQRALLLEEARPTPFDLEIELDL